MRAVDGRPDEFTTCRLILARRRRVFGEPFATAWPKALQALGIRPGRRPRVDDYAATALVRTAEAWQAGYERLPPPEPRYRSIPL